jgi:glycosyltransferase involved in cell wall biosynthesis
MVEALLDGTYAAFDLVHVRMDFSRDVDEIGAFRVRKIGHLVATIVRIGLARARHGAATLYYPPAGPNLVPICRDIAILVTTRWMFRRVIFHFHAAGVSEAYAQVPSPLRPLYRLAYLGADAGIRLSERTPDDPGALMATSSHVVANGVPDHSPTVLRRPVGDVPTLLYVGMLRESKGVLVLLEACAILKKHGVAFRLELLGAPQPLEFASILAEAIESAGLEDDVVMCGARSGQDKWRTYADADLFCFPSFYDSEAFPVVLLEAMQFGLPVVATDWRGIPSIVEDGRTGFLVPPRDAAALAERIESLLASPDLAAAMGERGRERFRDRFTADVFQRRMEEVIASVTSAGGRA